MVVKRLKTADTRYRFPFDTKAPGPMLLIWTFLRAEDWFTMRGVNKIFNATFDGLSLPLWRHACSEALERSFQAFIDERNAVRREDIKAGLETDYDCRVSSCPLCKRYLTVDLYDAEWRPVEEKPCVRVEIRPNEKPCGACKRKHKFREARMNSVHSCRTTVELLVTGYLDF